MPAWLAQPSMLLLIVKLRLLFLIPERAVPREKGKELFLNLHHYTDISFAGVGCAGVKGYDLFCQRISEENIPILEQEDEDDSPVSR